MSRWLHRTRRLPAGALMLVLVVSIIVAAVLLSLLFLTTNRRLLVQRDAAQQRVRRNLYSGLAYAQAHAQMTLLRRQSLDLFDEGRDSVTVEKKPWGMFDVAVVTASTSHFTDTIVALLGSQFSKVNRAALYLTDSPSPLSINDDAQVRGTVYIPKAESAHSANLPLAGTRRTGTAVTGSSYASRSQLPINCDSALARLHDYAGLQLQLLLAAGSRTSSELSSRHIPFAGPGTVLYQTGPATLRNLTLTGQIVVASSRRLIVDASNQLDNVLLVAPVVIVRAGFRGRVQIIARDTVDIQPNCELAYPSAVCAYASATTPTQIILGKNTRVQGLVVAAQPAGSPAACLIRMANGVAVEGQVFSAGAIENCGVVRGSVMCRHLIYRTPSTFYDNYLVNAVIDRQGLSTVFLTSPLLNAEAPTGIMAWLH